MHSEVVGCFRIDSEFFELLFGVSHAHFTQNVRHAAVMDGTRNGNDCKVPRLSDLGSPTGSNGSEHFLKVDEISKKPRKT